MSEPPHPIAALLPFGLFMLILLVTLVSPAMGMVVSLLIPAPLILLYLLHGKQVGLVTIGVVFLGIWLTLGPDKAMGFVASYALVAVIIGEGTRLGYPWDLTVGMAAIGPAILSGILVWLALSGGDQAPIQYFESQLQASAGEYMKALKASGAEQQELDFMKGIADQYTPLLARTFPAFLVVASLFAAVVNFAAVRGLWSRFYRPDVFERVDLSRWMLPDPLVWGFIGSSALVFLTDGALKVVGMNVMMVVLVLYFFQGMSIALHILRSKNAHGLVTAMVVVLTITQPMLTGLAIGLGLFDVWADFRKLRPQAVPPADDENDFED